MKKYMKFCVQKIWHFILTNLRTIIIYPPILDEDKVKKLNIILKSGKK